MQKEEKQSKRVDERNRANCVFFDAAGPCEADIGPLEPSERTARALESDSLHLRLSLHATLASRPVVSGILSSVQQSRSDARSERQAIPIDR